MDINDLISTYPRRRPPMSPEMTDVFEDIYKKNRQRDNWVNNLSKHLEAWMHRRVAKLSGRKVLEIGAGPLNHLKYETNRDTYDIIEPFTAMYENHPDLEKIGSIYSDIGELEKKKNKHTKNH